MNFRYSVAVVGATGHTGGMIVSELIRRGIEPIAIGRDPSTLRAAAFAGEVPSRRIISTADGGSVDEALRGAQLVINAAGPFADTAQAIVRGALRAGIHYVDVCAEQAATQATLATFDEAAREANVVVVPSVAFFGGLVDLLVTAALGDWSGADTVDVATGLDRWPPTRGTRITFNRKSPTSRIISGGWLVPASAERLKKLWDFGAPLGEQLLVEASFNEPVLISRHLKVDELNHFITMAVLAEVVNPQTPVVAIGDETGTAAQNFAIQVVATRGADERRIAVSGRDTYGMSARMATLAAVRLLEGRFRAIGARPPGAVFEPRGFLAELGLLQASNITVV